MDRNRLLIFIAVSALITFGFQYFAPPPRHVAHPVAATQTAASTPAPAATPNVTGTQSAGDAPPANAPRLIIRGARLQGSLSLIGARLDDVALADYHETVSKKSPLVRLLSPADQAQPSFIQLGWSAPAGTQVPTDATLWTSSGGDLTPDHPVTLSWDNGHGLSFSLALSLDRNYLFTVVQSVRNTGTVPADVLPWQRVRRDYAPPTAGLNVFEGLFGVIDGKINDIAWQTARKTATNNDGVAYTHDGAGGWAGFTDPYWLTAIIPQQDATLKTEWTYSKPDTTDHFQVSYQPNGLIHVAPGTQTSTTNRLFVGAKEVHLLDHYEATQDIPRLGRAVDWGWFYFITIPFFHAIDFLFTLTGNFGIAILILTIFVKLLFTPLAARSYRSMGKMRLLAPKIQAARDRFKDDPAKQQEAMMAVYKEEGISPAAQLGGCLPMLVQIPVFFSLYKVILISIEMRQAPFFGWIHDLSAMDPTNIFNVFGLLPFDPTMISPYLHLGIWPLAMGATMYVQQQLNPPPPDPAQARMFQFLPLIMMFTMGRFSAGLVIYWTWNNLLTIGQQWYIQNGVTLTKKKA
jgi:YidC/Oxa1 family membrane protein insertase